MKLMQVHNRKSGEWRYYVDGKRVSNHDYSTLWLRLWHLYRATHKCDPAIVRSNRGQFLFSTVYNMGSF